ncbi:MAG: DUF302 domain-containing protein [Anaerolineae bacterium]|nr:DUF302 domain-containing protein [Anaerolineae bacterium]
MGEKMGFQIMMDAEFEEAIEKVTAALKEEGFGVLTKIDVQATLKEKIDADFRPYAILGACNPPLAMQALVSEPQMGLMLPCNVTVDQQEQGVLVSIIDPGMMMGMEGLKDNEGVQQVAMEARERLLRVAEALKG